MQKVDMSFWFQTVLSIIRYQNGLPFVAVVVSSNTVQRSEIRRAAGTGKNAPSFYISTTLHLQFDKGTKRTVLRIGDFSIIRVWFSS